MMPRAASVQTALRENSLGGMRKKPSVVITSNEDIFALQLVKGWVEFVEKAFQEVSSPSHWAINPAAHIMVVSTVLVALNTIFIGIQVEVNISRAQFQQVEPVWIRWLDVCFTLAFILEMVARLAIFRCAFFRGDDRNWNLFELILVLSAVAEWTFSVFDYSFIRSLRVFRAIRVARVVRLVRIIRPLRLIVASIVCSLESLAWAFVFLAFVLYICAIFILKDVEGHMRSRGASNVDKDLMRFYGSLGDTMLSLFMAISGGYDWWELLRPLDTVAKNWYTLFFVFYVAVVVFGIMNILTAIFVESASHVSEIDRDLVIHEQFCRRNSSVNAMKRIFHAADTDKSNTITKIELEAHLQDPQVNAYLRFLEINIHEARGLFQLLDVDEKGQVTIEEFVMGMLRLQGSAKGVDAATLMYENKRIFARLTVFMNFVQDKFAMLDRTLSVDSSRWFSETGKGDGTVEEYLAKQEVEYKQTAVNEL